MRYSEYIDEMNRLESEKADLCKRMINDIKNDESHRLTEALYFHLDYHYLFDLIRWKIEKMAEDLVVACNRDRLAYSSLLDAKTAINDFLKSESKSDLARFFDIVINNYEGWWD